MIRTINKLTVNFLMAALVALNLALPATANNSLQLVGKLTPNGEVTVNGKKVINETSIFNDSRVSVNCASSASALINLGKLGRIQLSPGTDIVVRFADGLISGELLNGKAVVNNAAGVKVNFTTPEGVSSADGKEAASLAINTQKGTRCVPMTGKASGKSGSHSGGGSAAIGAGGIAAIAAGAGGAAIITGVAASGRRSPDFNASFTLP